MLGAVRQWGQKSALGIVHLRRPQQAAPAPANGKEATPAETALSQPLAGDAAGDAAHLKSE